MVAPEETGDFLAFADLLTGYRQSEVLMLAHEAGVFAAVGREGRTGTELCARLGWEAGYGERFFRCLCGLGLLHRDRDSYRLTRFSATFLDPESDRYQGRTLAFERQLHQSWQQLAATLAAGRRVFATENKSPEALSRTLAVYLGAMDEAARIRAREVWAALPMATARGVLLDMGAGSGAFLATFLARYPGWRGIYCDLPQVAANRELHQGLAEMSDRVAWCGCNLLAEETAEFDAIADRSCDLVLLSNLVHCQGPAETGALLARAAAKTAGDGLLIVHDFFCDAGWRGALYDLHMLLNTYNGRTYEQGEIIAFAAAAGLGHHLRRQLPSGSVLLVCARNAKVLESLRDRQPG